MSPVSFIALWSRNQASVAAFIGALVPHAADADDLQQEVAVLCQERFAEYDPSRPFAAWACGMARMRVRGHFRDRGRACPTRPWTACRRWPRRRAPCWPATAPVCSAVWNGSARVRDA
ncbi:MAG: sigma factor [Planctomycetota bacterium]